MVWLILGLARYFPPLFYAPLGFLVAFGAVILLDLEGSAVGVVVVVGLVVGLGVGLAVWVDNLLLMEFEVLPARLKRRMSSHRRP